MSSSEHPGIVGIFGHPYLDLEPFLDVSGLQEVHDEICLALAQTPLDYTGGSHRAMGIMPPSRSHEALVDYQEVIAALPPAEFEVFRSLSDHPQAIDPAQRAGLEFGEERAIPLSRRQMHWLKIRHGVFFPWKGYVELIPNGSWGDKSDARGKSFTRLARAYYPRTIAFVASLPFEHIGRCNIMGLEAFDYGTVHRDGEPEEQAAPDHFISFVPHANKRLFLWDETRGEAVDVASKVYWFNDHDYHGVHPDPFFRYSVRVDGVFKPEFYARLERAYRRAA